MSALWPRYNARVTTTTSTRSYFLKRMQRARGTIGPIIRRTQHSAVAGADGGRPRPRLLQPSVWDSIFPRSLREGIVARWRKAPTAREEKQSNPASFFIWIFLFIGSQSVRILGLKNEHKAYTRKADLKLAQLREVVEKLHGGEEVDVEKVLGTGDESQELEWEEAMRELATEELRWQQSREKAREEQARQEKEQQDADPVNDNSEAAGAAGRRTEPKPAAAAPATEPPPITAAPKAPGFY